MSIDSNGIIRAEPEPMQCDGMQLLFSDHLPNDAVLMLSLKGKPVAFVAGVKGSMLIGLSTLRKNLQDSLTYID